MQTWETITSRRNVRSFADRPIPVADLDQILEAGRRSPSSQNWQPWDFIVVTDRAQLRELARVWRGAGHVAGSAATIVVIGPAADNEFHRAHFDLGQATMVMMLAAGCASRAAARAPAVPSRLACRAAPDAGTIEVLGGTPATDPAQLARVGFLAQNAPVYARLSVADHLKLGARLNPGWDAGLARGRVDRLDLDPGQKGRHPVRRAAGPACADPGRRQTTGVADPGRAGGQPGPAGPAGVPGRRMCRQVRSAGGRAARSRTRPVHLK